MNTLIILGVFSSLGAKIGGGLTAFALTFGFVKKWAKIVDKIAQFISKWSGKIYLEIQEHSEIFLNIQNTAQKVDEAIDADGKTNLSTLKEAMSLGKKVIVDLEDMIVEFKPKK